MGTGYVRNDTANTIANGNVIDADALDGEFNAVETAFQASTGHNHDGSAANGAPITKLGPTQDVVASATILYPKTTNTVSLGTASLKFKDAYFDGIVYTDDITLNGTAITATAAELNTLDGITASTAELNIMDGVTATAAEINVLDGITASTTELNYVDGVTSAIQTQLDNKQPLDADLTAIGALAKADGNIIVGDGTTWVAESGDTARASLGVSIGSQVQAWDATLTALAAFNTDGILTQTAADAFTGRTIEGTANQISVTNGNGVAGNPVISADVASQAEAEAGTDATKLMTPQRVAQAIGVLGAKSTTLGSTTTTSGTSKSFTGLDLTKYSFFVLAWRGVSAGSVAITLNGFTVAVPTSASSDLFGFTIVDLSYGTYATILSQTTGTSGILTTVGYSGDSSISKSTTTITLASSAAFDSGAIAIFGIA